MKKFKIYLDDQLASAKDKENRANENDKEVYLKQWLKTKHAIMFRLNNKIFQVDFFDGSRVSLNTETKAVLMLSKKG
jgi:polo-like kinase 1